MFKMKCVACEFPYNKTFTVGKIYIYFDGQFADNTTRIWTDRERLNSIDNVNKVLSPYVKFELFNDTIQQDNLKQAVENDVSFSFQYENITIFGRDIQGDKKDYVCGISRNGGYDMIFRHNYEDIIKVISNECNYNNVVAKFNDFLAKKENKSIWEHINVNFMNEEDYCVYVDGYKTDDENEEGEVIAKINIYSGKITYMNELAKTDKYAQRVIKNFVRCL